MTINWNENRPRDTELLSELGKVWRSFKTSVQQSFETAFYMTSSLSTGELRQSSATTYGGYQAYYGPASETSTPARPGTLMLTSDTSRLVVFDSTGSYPIGGRRALYSAQTLEVGPVGAAVVSVVSVASSLSTHVGNRIPFGITYNGIPSVTITPYTGAYQDPVRFITYKPTDRGSSLASHSYALGEVGTSSFSLYAWYHGNTTGAPSRSTASSFGAVFWRSVGTVTFP